MRRLRFRSMFAAMVMGTVVVPVGLAWACVGIVSVSVANPSVQPGGTVQMTGREFAQGAPVDIHLDAADGPILVSVPPPTGTMTSVWNVDVPIPSKIAYGDHVLIAVQNYHNMNVGSPARASIHVGTLPGATVPPAARPATPLVGSGPSGMSLFLIGLGVAAGLLLIAAVWSAAAGGARNEPEAQTVKTS